MLVNGILPNRSTAQDDTRVFCARCMSVGAWDGLNTYFYCCTAAKMGHTLDILRKLSIHIATGNFQVKIIAPKAIEVDLSSIPAPIHYEYAMSL